MFGFPGRGRLANRYGGRIAVDSSVEWAPAGAGGGAGLVFAGPGLV